MEKGNSTPVLGSLLTEGPIRMITQGIELSAEYDEKFLSEVPVKDQQVGGRICAKAQVCVHEFDAL